MIAGGAYYYTQQTRDEAENYSPIVASLKDITDQYTHQTSNQQQQSYPHTELTQELEQRISAEIDEIESRVIADDYQEGDLTIDDQKFEDYMVLAMKYQSLGQWDEAAKTYTQAIEEYPNRPLSWYNLGTFQVKAGAWQSATNNLIRSLELDSDYLPAWSQLIDFYRYKIKAHQPDMMSLYELALEYTNNSVTIIKDYAYYLDSIGEKQLALDYWKQAYDLAQNNHDIILQNIQRLEVELKNAIE
ncbi:MAG: tetratricopeptide repeat protein [Candidatus Komeilibacteria bacterium]